MPIIKIEYRLLADYPGFNTNITKLVYKRINKKLPSLTKPFYIIINQTILSKSLKILKPENPANVSDNSH